MRSDQFASVFRFHKLLFGSLALVFGLNLLATFWIRDAELSRIPELDRIYEAKRKARLPQRADTLQTRMDQSREDILRFVGSLPEKLVIAESMQEILELLSRNGLPGVSMSFAPESTEFPGLAKYVTTFSVNGKYASLRAFLADVQNSKSLFCIEGLTFSNQSKESEEVVSLSLKLSIYLRSDDRPTL